MKKHIKESHSWDDFVFPTMDNFLPSTGEGSTKATQIATAVNKLIYKWFNDGDVYDNTYALEGWANDISSYANWLYYNLPGAKDILNKIERVRNEDEYVDLLFELGTLAEETIMAFETTSSVESVYDCDGPFEFREALTCPECGGEMSDFDSDAYGMCYDCHQAQQEESEDYGEDDFDESVNRKTSKLHEDEENGMTATIYVDEKTCDWDMELFIELLTEAFQGISVGRAGKQMARLKGLTMAQCENVLKLAQTIGEDAEVEVVEVSFRY